MAPPAATPTALAVFDSRQEACALSCLASTDAGSCTALDASCLCASSAWGELVLSCIQSTCETETSLDTAYSQLLLYCDSVSVSFTLAEPAYTGTATADSAAVTSAAAAASSSAVAALRKQAVNVSAIMAGVCSLLFVIALLVGYFGIKEKLAKQRDQSTMKPSSWSGGKQAAPGQKLSSADPGEKSRGPATKNKPSGASVGAQSSLFGGATSNFDSASYADLEMEDLQQQARRARLNAEAQRQQNLDSLFTSPDQVTSSSSRSLSSTKDVSSAAANSDDDDDSAQYVTLPALNRGGAADDGPLPTASTFAHSDAEGWGRSPTAAAAAGDSTVALTKDEPARTPTRG